MGKQTGIAQVYVCSKCRQKQVFGLKADGLGVTCRCGGDCYRAHIIGLPLCVVVSDASVDESYIDVSEAGLFPDPCAIE